MLMHNKSTKFGSWSVSPAEWDKEKQQSILIWNLENEGIIYLPMMKQYKYLGIWMKYNPSLSKHLLFLKEINLHYKFLYKFQKKFQVYQVLS